MAGAEVAGELALEGRDLGAEDERAAVQDAGDGGVDLGAQGLEGRTGIEEGDRHAGGR